MKHLAHGSDAGVSRCPFFAALTMIAAGAVAGSAFAADAVTHRFLAFGGETRIVEENGTTSWTFPESSRDGHMLANGHVLLALSKSDARPHGAVVEVAPDPSGKGGRIVFEFAGTQSEINTAQRLADGRTMVAEAGDKPRILVIDAKGAIVWKVSNADFDRPLLNDPCGAQRLANGNTVICSYAIGDGGTKLVEVTREKKVVWTFIEKDGPGIHEVEILSTGGLPTAAPALR
jgi:hypothetical protein